MSVVTLNIFGDEWVTSGDESQATHHRHNILIVSNLQVIGDE